MIELTFPMWRDGVKTELAEVLDCVPANEWHWNVLEFDGVGRMPGGMTVAEFERVAQRSPLGHGMSWLDLRAFAADVYDAWWLLAVASMPGVELIPDDVRNEKYDRAVFVLRGFDSTSWEVWASVEHEGSVAALELLRTKFGRPA